MAEKKRALQLHPQGAACGETEAGHRAVRTVETYGGPVRLRWDPAAAVETGLSEGILYQDTRRKVLSIPGADPGSVIGYEYKQRGRPLVLQDSWGVGSGIPVRRARYILGLPSGWEVDTNWVNHPGAQAREAGTNRWIWELAPTSPNIGAKLSWRATSSAAAATI